jgi:hypothetical protein
MKTSTSSKRSKPTKAKVRNLTPRSTRAPKGGGISDLGQKLQQTIHEANSIYTR